MKDLIDLLPFFQSYQQSWIRWLVVIWILFTSSLGCVLLFATRAGVSFPELSIDALRAIKDKNNNSLTFELIVRNSLPQLVQLTEIQMSLFGKDKPVGGLQSTTETSTTYVIKQLDSGNFSVNEANKNNLHHNLNISYPYFGQDYIEAKIPISQTISSDSADRFIVQFLDADFISQYHKNIEMVILYNGDKLTKPKNAEL